MPIGLFLLGSLVFGLSRSAFPLYSINQHAHLLRGLADAGLGYLNQDWYANTTDPFPVVTFATEITYRYLHDSLFYVYYMILVGVYFYSIVGIAATIFKIDSPRLKYVVFLTVIIVINTRAFGFVFEELFDLNLTRVFQHGVASFRLLSFYFQPSLIGVFVLFSIHLFLLKKRYLAIFFLGLAAVGSSSYILPMLVFTAAYMYVVFQEGRSFRKPLLIGAFSALFILPLLAYAFLAFRQTSPELLSESLSILVNLRAPVHHDPSEWLGPLTFVKTGVVIIALSLVRRTPLFPVLFVPLAFAVVLTVAQIITDSTTIAAASPWRISVILVPLSTAVIVGFAVSRAFELLQGRVYPYEKVLMALCVGTVALLVVAGVLLTRNSFQDHRADPSVPMMTFVRDSTNQGDQYLIPTDLRRFRVYTGAPIFVDFWSFPFKDADSIEWRDRYLFTERFYEPEHDAICRDVDALSTEYGITHVVLDSAKFGSSCSNLAQTYGDDFYQVFQVTP